MLGLPYVDCRCWLFFLKLSSGSRHSAKTMANPTASCTSASSSRLSVLAVRKCVPPYPTGPHRTDIPLQHTVAHSFRCWASDRSVLCKRGLIDWFMVAGDHGHGTECRKQTMASLMFQERLPSLGIATFEACSHSAAVVTPQLVHRPTSTRCSCRRLSLQAAPLCISDVERWSMLFAACQNYHSMVSAIGRSQRVHSVHGTAGNDILFARGQGLLSECRV